MSATTQKSLFDSRKVLQLNKGWVAINTITLRDAMKLVCREYNDGTPAARIIDIETYQALDWSDWSKLRPKGSEFICSADMNFRIPEVIVLTSYDKIPKIPDKFSRRELLIRDNYECQYCGIGLTRETYTMDHIHPQCYGGKNTWENTVIACFKCNVKKGNKTLAEAGLKLRSIPAKPKRRFRNLDLSHKIDSWQAFLGEMYWNMPLQH